MPQRMNSYCRWHLVKLCVCICLCVFVCHLEADKDWGVGGLDGGVRSVVLSM